MNSEGSAWVSRSDRLYGAWEKVRWADAHVDQLRAEIGDSKHGDAVSTVLASSRKFDPDRNEVVWTAERVPEISEDWGLLVGDALHNLRAALDHLWWQLAVDHLGRKPTHEEVKLIQFPITDWSEQWSGNRFLQFVDAKAADKAKEFQAHYRRNTQMPVLGILAVLNNIDKHRGTHLVFLTTRGHGLPHPPPDAWRDCRMPTEGGQPRMKVWMGADRIKVGDEVMGIRVVRTGPNPDVDVEPQLFGHVTLSNGESVLALLDAIRSLVKRILREFRPLLKPALPEGLTPGHA